MIYFKFELTTHDRKFTIASMVDQHARQPVLIIIKKFIPAEDLVAALQKSFALWNRPPQVLRCDNGPQFISEELRRFCRIRLVSPSRPWKNSYIESFNSRVRDECVNMNEFRSLLDTRVVIEDWKDDYNNLHRHSSLACRTPNEYAASCIHTH
ncbi:integrase core domain-containing protein [Rhodococcus erythropolis]|nr:integrase core domain-containing protein [Rhodococcus erythropolis]